MEQDKKFKCNICGKTYKLKSILLLHSMKCEEDNKNNQLNKEAIDVTKKNNLQSDKEFKKVKRQAIKISKGTDYIVTTDDNANYI